MTTTDPQGAAFLDNYRWLARYNAWFNGRLYDACERLSEEERRRDRGAFFGSIHGTLNHLVWGDRLWLRRFAAQGTMFASLPAGLVALPDGAMHATVLHEDWEALRSERRALDAAIQAWTGEMAADWPLRTFRYVNTKGEAKALPAWQAITHFFNHQTHHRGQVTTLLAQAGVDPGVTDALVLAGR